MALSANVRHALVFTALLWLAALAVLSAQQTPSSLLTPVPRVVWFSGAFRPADGGAVSQVEIVTVAVYGDRQGGNALWQETQPVAIAADGGYNLLLGSKSSDGLPLDLFTVGEPRWIGITFHRAAEAEQPRVALASVPYAIKAADADTLGGKPLSAFVLAEPTAATSNVQPGRSTAAAPVISPAVSGTGSTNQVTKWLDTVGTLGNSAITESAGKVGIGTLSPQGTLHLFGSATADIFAGMGPNLFSGPAFNYGYAGGSIGRSVGFFNVRPDASAVAPNPSLRFLTNNLQRMIIANSGNVGIGVTVPVSALDVAGDINMTGPLRQSGTTVLDVPASGNTAIGRSALVNMTGINNTAIGSSTLSDNTGGTHNTAAGVIALTNNISGSLNTAIGWGAMQLNTAGNFSTAVGANALGGAMGSSNIALGSSAGSNVAAGSNNIEIGHSGLSGDSGVIRIGTPGTQTTFFAAGVSGVPTGLNDAIPVLIDSSGQLGTVSSSRRFKEDIQDMGDASRTLLRLRPVTFRYKNPFADGSKPIQYGLIAEEVAEVYPDLVAHSADGQIETVKYQLLDVLLLNEVQRQKAEIDDLRQRLAKLEAAQAVRR